MRWNLTYDLTVLEKFVPRCRKIVQVVVSWPLSTACMTVCRVRGQILTHAQDLPPLLFFGQILSTYVLSF